MLSIIADSLRIATLQPPVQNQPTNERLRRQMRRDQEPWLGQKRRPKWDPAPPMR